MVSPHTWGAGGANQELECRKITLADVSLRGCPPSIDSHFKAP